VSHDLLKGLGFMRYLKGLFCIALFLITGSFLISCSGGKHSDGTASGESEYAAGRSVAAVSYDKSYPIELKIQGDGGEFVPAADGMFVTPGIKRCAVYPKGDQSNILKVLVGDGGVYQVEAVKQGDSYQCDFEIRGDRLYSTVLVQVIHADKKASKEKIVFRTYQDYGDGRFLINGMGMLIAQDLLDREQDQIAFELDQFVGQIFDCIRSQDAGLLSQLSYGDGNPGTVDIKVNAFEAVQSDAYPSAVIHAGFTIQGVNLSALNLYGQDLITTSNNDLQMDLYIALEDEYGDGQRGLVIDLLGSSQVQFKNDFFLRPVLEKILESQLQVIKRAPVSADLQYLFDELGDALPATIHLNDSDVDLKTLFAKMNVDLAKYLFVDLYGMPEESIPGALGIGAGFSIADYDEVLPAESHGPPLQGTGINDVFINLCEPLVDQSFDNIRQKYSGVVTDLTYGDNDPGTDDLIVNSLQIGDTGDVNIKNVRADITIKDVDLQAISLFGFPLIRTDDNDLTIDASFLLTYQQNGNNPVLILDVQDVHDVYFEEYFLGREVVEGIVKEDVADLENMVLNVNDVFKDLNIKMDLSGCGSQGLMFPDVDAVASPNAWDLILQDEYNFSCAVSQDSINELFTLILKNGFEWDAYEIVSSLLGKDFPGFNKGESTGEETIIRLSVPPVLDLRSSRIRMELDDILVQYRLNGEAQWEASVDLDLILEAHVVNGELRIYLSSVPENCHFHIMKDNRGNLGVFDHSNLVNTIVEGLPVMLGKSPGDPVLTVSLDDLDPIVSLDRISNPLLISAGGGYLYIDAAVLDFDLSWLMDQFVK
jgi:hypothetical protein